MTWRTYNIAPVTRCGKHGARSIQAAPTEGFYAPSLEYAFALARAKWPTFTGWTCSGAEPRPERS